MLSSNPILTPSLLSLSLLLPSLISAATPSQGSVSLWSDSGCGQGDTLAFTEPVVIALNHTSSPDECYTLPREAHSYRVDRHPVCANGNTAGFAFYGGDNCVPKGFGPALNSEFRCDDGYDCTKYDGYCLALVTFKSVAFICEGVGQGSSSSGSSSTSSNSPPPSSSNTYTRDSTSTSALLVDHPTSKITTTPTPKTTTITTSSISKTNPLSPTTTKHSNNSTAATGTNPSQTGGYMIPASPVPFTGGAVRTTMAGPFRWSVVAVAVFVGLRG